MGAARPPSGLERRLALDSADRQALARHRASGGLERYARPDWNALWLVSCSALILIQAPSCAYSTRSRLDGGQQHAHPRRRRTDAILQPASTATTAASICTPRRMYVCILDPAGKVLVHQQPARRRPRRSSRSSLRTATISSSPSSASSPGTGSPTSAPREGIAFVLGHALYMKAIHGGKAKNDKIDCPQDRRPAARRDASPGLRLPGRDARHPRSAAPPPAPRPQARPAPRPHPEHQPPVQPAGPRQAHRLPGQPRRASPSTSPTPPSRKSIAVDLALIDHYDELIAELELYLVRRPSSHDPARLPSAPLRPRHRQDPGADDPLRDPRHPPLRPRPGLRLLRAAGEVRARVGGQEARHRRREDRQRASQVGLLRGRRRSSCATAPRQEAARTARAQARQGQGALASSRTSSGAPSTTCCARSTVVRRGEVLATRERSEERGARRLTRATGTELDDDRVAPMRSRAQRHRSGAEGPAARRLDWTPALAPTRSSVVRLSRLCPSPEPGDNGRRERRRLHE